MLGMVYGVVGAIESSCFPKTLSNGPLREAPPIDQNGKDEALAAVSVAVVGDLRVRLAGMKLAAVLG